MKHVSDKSYKDESETIYAQYTLSGSLAVFEELKVSKHTRTVILCIHFLTCWISGSPSSDYEELYLLGCNAT
jgi:hypothetical protein